MKFLVYAAVDLSLIDGSSTWLTAVAEVLSRDTNNHVCVLLRTDLMNFRLVETLRKRPNVTLVNPFHPDGTLLPASSPRPSKPRLSPDEARDRLEDLAASFGADFVITRCEETSRRVSAAPALASRHVPYMTNLHGCDSERQTNIRAIVEGAVLVLCQTELVAADLRTIVPGITDDKIILLPPIIPDINNFRPRLAPSASPTLIYAGKFSPSYYSLETLDAFAAIRQSNPAARFRILGDKFHNHPPVADFETRVRDKLLSLPGVDWRGATGREQVQREFLDADIGASWRDPEMARSPEISTKVLEYASAGLPILLRRGGLYESLFGRDYPGFVETANDFVQAFNRLSKDHGLYAEASAISVSNAEQFSMDAVSRRLVDAFASQRSRMHARPEEPQRTGFKPVSSDAAPARQPPPGARKTRIVIAGHKLNFIEPLMSHFERSGRYEVRLDTWKNHTAHDEAYSRELLDWADAIFCEWCLGNAVWYSNNKRPGQKLLVRLHAQEMGLRFKKELNWSAVDKLISISPQNHQILLKEFAAHQDRIALVYNCFETSDFRRQKSEDAKFNLGLVGFVPKIKRADLAIDLLRRLRAHDNRFHLFILGKQPEEYPWMLTRDNEMKWYADVRNSIRDSGLAEAVTFDPFTDDPAGWYSKIGFLLSMSDHEGSHQAVAEGMASGARPIIRNWYGADMLYPPAHVFDDMDAAVELVLNLREGFDYDGRDEALSRDACDRFDTAKIGAQIDALLV
jgi:glycosyltransferase involved in cell wall biosynthesis